MASDTQTFETKYPYAMSAIPRKSCLGSPFFLP